MPRTARTLADPPDWFWSKVVIGGPDECWPARSGSVGHQGHRLIRVNGRALGAHVIAWCLANNRLEPPTGWILHHCDNPPCCNPNHLYEGDVRDNVRDMVARGRHRNQVKTHCINGHELTPENTYIPPSMPGSRRCRTCQRIKNKEIEERKTPEEREAKKARRVPYPCPVCGEAKNYSSMRRHIQSVHENPPSSRRPNGDIIRRRRIECGLTQQELADLAGVTRGTVRRAESSSQLRPKTRARIEEALAQYESSNGSPGATHCAALAEKAGIPVRRWTA